MDKTDTNIKSQIKTYCMSLICIRAVGSKLPQPHLLTPLLSYQYSGLLPFSVEGRWISPLFGSQSIVGALQFEMPSHSAQSLCCCRQQTPSCTTQEEEISPPHQPMQGLGRFGWKRSCFPTSSSMASSSISSISSPSAPSSPHRKRESPGPLTQPPLKRRNPNSS